MTLIADSGSTKTTWATPETGDKYVTEGLNPHFTDNETFMASCEKVKRNLPCEQYDNIIFYGAGCGNTTMRNRVKKQLEKCFGTNNIEVETDMLGACRASAGENAGIVGILGTGSNSCYYDGKSIKIQTFSTGYILGDEGSANHVGRLLLKAYLTDDMPDFLSALFHERYKLSKNKLVEKLYHDPNANRWLASLAPFVTENKNNEFCNNILSYSINSWINEQIEPLISASQSRHLYVVGGFAEVMKKLLEEELKTLRLLNINMTVKKVVPDPIDGLISFHQK